MTIDEAIEHFRIIEQDSRQEAINIESNLYLPKTIDRDRLVTDCNMVADTNKQIAEWLEELKELRKFKEDLLNQADGYLANMCELIGYNKAIDDVMEKAKEIQLEQINNLNQSTRKNGKMWGRYMITYLGHIQNACNRLIAEQLKAGGKDD